MPSSAFLTLNGIEIPVAQASQSVSPLGKDSRAFNGRMRRTRRGLRREWRFISGLLTLEEATALRGLVEGRGEHWGFDRPTSSGGTTPSPPTAYSDAGLPAALSGAAFKAVERYPHGAGLEPTDPYSSYAAYDVERSSAWTLLYFGSAITGEWAPVVLRSDGARWQDTVRKDWADMRVVTYDASSGVLRRAGPAFGGTAWAANQTRTRGSRTLNSSGSAVFECMTEGTTGATAPAWPTSYDAAVNDGTVVWRHRGVSAARVLDLAWVPYLMPDAWISQVTARLRGGPWGELPRLSASGSFAPEPLAARGEVVDAKSTQFMRAGALVSGEQVTFLLREV